MLRKRTFQNKVAASRYSLPVTATLAALVWVAVGLLLSNIWVQFAFTIISTFLMVELNNRNSLMRTYSRMVSCSFLVLVTMAGLPSMELKSSIVTMCFIAFYLIVWNTYQDKQSAGLTFYAFCCIGLASLVFVQIGYVLPVLWVLMAVFTLSLSVRTFFASLLGLIAPYWFSAGYYFYTDNLPALIKHFTDFIDFRTLFDYSAVTDHQLINLGFITLLTVISSIHFIRTSYADKIRTRLIYESFVVMDIVTLAFIVLMPCCYDNLIGIMVVNTAPLVAHFVTYTHTKITNIVFIAMLVTAVVLLLFNLLYPETILL